MRAASRAVLLVGLLLTERKAEGGVDTACHSCRVCALSEKTARPATLLMLKKPSVSLSLSLYPSLSLSLLFLF